MAAKNAIPAIDLSPLHGGSGIEKREVARQIDAACTEIGFFIVTGHGISQNLITTARQQAIDFFATPVACYGDGSVHVIDIPKQLAKHNFRADTSCESLGFF
jgi:hypothetical protein